MNQYPPAPAPASDPAPLRVQLLGGFSVSRGDRTIPDGSWRLSKARSLVKLLALSPGHQLHRDQVIDLLWPDLDPAAASNNLHQILHAARRALAGVEPAPVLVLQRQVLALAPPIPLQVDVDQFEEAARAAQASLDPAACYAALDLYTGELLPEDRYEDWTIERRDALAEEQLQLLSRLAELHERRQEYAPAIDALRRASALDPARESVTTGLMRLYALTGRPQQALRLYQRLEEALGEEFDAEPAPETQRLYRAILDRRFPPPEAAAPPAPEPAAPVAASPATPSPAPALAPPAERRLGPLVDRVRELALLEAALAEAMGGQGQVVLLAGEPGIGKTRLAQEGVRIARERGATVLWGRSYEGEGAPAYWPWVQVGRNYAAGVSREVLREDLGAGASDIALVVPELRDLFPDLEPPPVLDPDQARFRLFDAFTTFLTQATTRGPLMIVLDDLHWADRSSLLLLEFLVDSLSRLPLLIVATYRDVEIDRRHPLVRTLARLSREEGSRRIQLSGLGIEDVARFSEVTAGRSAPPGLTEAIYAQTEGNPFFIREVIRLLVEEGRFTEGDDVRSWRMSIPQGVREAVTLRLDRLSATAGRVLSIAAVIGREFSMPVLQRVCDLSPPEVLEAVEEGLDTGTIDESASRPGVFRFGHALVQQTLYEEMSRVRRIGLHRRIGEALEALYAENLGPWLELLAWHYAQAAIDGQGEKAIEYLALAGAQAMDRVAWAEAANHFSRALEILETEPPPIDERRCELLLSLGEAQKNAGDTEEGGRTFEHAVQIARTTGNAPLLARAALGVAESVLYSGFWYEGFVDVLEEALNALGSRDDPLRVQLLSRLVIPLNNDPSAKKRVLALTQEAVDLAQRIGDPSLQALALSARLIVYWSPEDVAGRTADADAVVRFAGEAVDTRLLISGHAWRIFIGLEKGDIQAVEREIEAYGQVAERTRLPHNRWGFLLRRAMRLLMFGQYAQGEELIEQAFATGIRPMRESAIANHLLQRFVLLRDCGGLPELAAPLRALADEYPRLPIWRCLLALLAAESGDQTVARAEVELLAAHGFSDMPPDNFWLGNLAILADVCVVLNERPHVLLLDKALHPFAGRHVSPGTNAVYLGPVALYLGNLAAVLGHLDEAEHRFRDAEQEAEQMGARPFVLRAQLGQALVCAGRDSADDAARAVELARLVLDGARELGMQPLVAQAERIIAGPAG